MDINYSDIKKHIVTEISVLKAITHQEEVHLEDSSK